MPRRRVILQVVTTASVLLLVIIGAQSHGNPTPAGEVRHAPVFGQNRPVFLKPSPKPKLVLKPPQQLQVKEQQAQAAQAAQEAQEAKDANSDVEKITQTVYGFLDFVTTIGNTVMVFTPQTKKVEAENVQPTATAGAVVTVKPTAKPESRIVQEEEEQENVNSVRQPKNLKEEEGEEQVVIEASEVEPQVYPSSSTQVNPPLLKQIVNFASEEKYNAKKSQFVSATAAAEPEVRTQVNVVSSSPNLSSGEFIEGEFTSSEEKAEDEESDVEPPPVKSTPPPSTTPPPPPPPTQPPTPPPPPASKPKSGFTLKLTPKHSSPVIVTPAFSTPVVVTAQKVNLPPPPPPPPSSTSSSLQPTGVLNQIFETKVNSGTTTVVETKILGTYIGTQYARLLESTSSVIPVSVTKKIEATKSISFPSLVLPTSKTSFVVAQKAPTTPPPPTSTTTTPTTTTTQPDNVEEDSPVPQEEEDFAGGDDTEDTLTSSSSPPVLEPTPTASEEQTHYILPQKADTKKPEKIYVSAIPSPNAYSRQPQLYVDINPAKSVDTIVTATPSRGKQFRLTNRFSNRGNKNQGSDSNELTHPQEIVAVPDDTSSPRNQGRSRFGRNRGRSSPPTRVNEDVSTVSVYSHIVSATPTRRFKSGGRTASSNTLAATSATRNKDFSSYKTARGFSPGSGSRQQAQITPTTSSSIYRFKLNRPTGRWRFKPSPKPKVNIIKTKEDEEVEGGDPNKEVQVQSPTNGPVYLQAYDGELQHPEETRTESNELVQEIEPELAQQTLRVATITPTEFTDLDKYLEIATIKSPYVFQAGNVKNTRFITVTKTFTREVIQPTLSSSVVEASLENILATKPPYEKILEGSSDVATLPVIVLNGDMATPPLETITQSFSTTQLMLKTSILPVLYEGVTTLYTLTQSYFITRLVTAHKTVPPVELFQFVPTKSLTEFNTALQEAGSEHREHLLGSENEDESDTNYEHIIAPPDELTSVGSDFDPSSMDDKLPKRPLTPKFKEQLVPKGKSDAAAPLPNNPFATPSLNSIQDPLANIAGLTPEQLAFIRYFTAQNQQAQPQPQQLQPQQFQPQQFQPQQFQPQQFQPQQLPPPQALPQYPQLPAAAPQIGQQFSYTSSPVVVDTTATVVETKTLRLLFGAKPTHTLVYSTRVVPTRMTSYVTASVPVQATAAINNPFLNALPFPLAYVG